MADYRLGLFQQNVILDGLVQANADVLITFAGRGVAIYTDALMTSVLSFDGLARTDAAGMVSFYIPYSNDRKYTLCVLNADRSVRGQFQFKPAPPMVLQSFLPYITDDRRILAIVAIPPTTYSGSETSVMVGGVPVDTRTIFSEFPVPKAFLGIRVKPEEERASFSPRLPGLDNQTMVRTWYQPQGYRHEAVSYGTLLSFLLDAVPAPTTTPIVLAAGGPVAITFEANFPYSNTPGFLFMDVNIQELAGVSQSPYLGSSLAIPSVPTATHAAGDEPNPLRAMVVHTMQQAMQGGGAGEIAVTNTVRVIKVVAGAVPVGIYTWPVTVTFADGRTLAVPLNVTVV